MRIVFIEPLGYSGIFNHAISLAQSLIKLGYKVDFITSIDHLEFQDSKNINIIQLLGGMNKKQNEIRRGIAYLFSWKNLFSWLYKNNPEILHYHQFTTPYLDWLLFLALKILGFRIVLSLHEIEPRIKMLPQWITYVCLWFIYRFPDAIIVHSNFASSELIRKYGNLSNKIYVIPHGNFELYFNHTRISRSEARQTLGLPSIGFILLFFGTIRDNKGLDILIKSLPYIDDSGDGFYLLIAGALERKVNWEDYLDIIEEYNVADKVITRIGYIPKDILPNYFFASDVVVCPYTQIYQSGVVYLAYTFNKPVIVTNVGGLPEVVIHGETGALVQPNNPKELAKSINYFLHNPIIADKLGRSGNLRTKTIYSWNVIAKETIEIYQSITST